MNKWTHSLMLGLASFIGAGGANAGVTLSGRAAVAPVVQQRPAPQEAAAAEVRKHEAGEPIVLTAEMIQAAPQEKIQQAYQTLIKHVKIGDLVQYNGKLMSIVGISGSGVDLQDLSGGPVVPVSPPAFVALCAAGGPILFGACLLVALVLISTAAG